MASRQSVNSILKPSKVRAPLKEIEPVDQDADENTESLPKRKVSFSGMNKIKMYNTGATSLTVHQAPMFDEQISVLSDSSNAEKTKLLEASQKSNNQIILNSTNCTTIEDNKSSNKTISGDYDIPNDNMEMTEALSCKIFSDEIYTIDNNGFEHGDYNSDYSDSNMEFTDVIKTAQIITHENELDFSSIETFNDNKEHSDAQTSNINLTCVTSSQKSILSYCKSDMDLTELPNTKIHENNCALIFEDQHSISTASDMSSNISMDIDPPSEDSEYDVNYINAENEQNDSLKITEQEQNNYSNVININCQQNVQPKISIVSTGQSLFSEMLDNNINKSDRIEGPKEKINVDTSAVDQYQLFVNNKMKNYSRKSMGHSTPLIVQEKSSRNEYLPYTSVVVEENDQKNSFVLDQAHSFEKKNISDTLVIENAPATFYNKSHSFEDEDSVTDIPIMVEENQQKKYSRKSIVPTLIFNESQLSENEEISNTPLMVEKNEQKIYSQQSNTPVSFHDKSQSFEVEDSISDIPIMVEENQQKKYSRKSIVPTLIFNESQLSENEEISNTPMMVEKNEQKIYSQQSNTPVSFHDKSQSFEDEDSVSDIPIMIEENQQKKYSRKSIVPTLIFNESQLSENEEISNTPILVEENEQKRFSQQTNVSMAFHNESPSLEDERNILDIPKAIDENIQKGYCRNSITPTFISNQSQYLDNGDPSDKFILVEGNYQKTCSTKSSIILVSNTQSLTKKHDTCVTAEANKQKKYSRKTIGPSSILNHSESPNDSMFDKNLMDEKSNKSSSRMAMTCVSTEFINDISIISKVNNQLLDVSNKHEERCISKIGDNDFNSPFRKKSRLSIAPKNVKCEIALENHLSDNYGDNSKMDISIELKDNSMFNKLNISSKEVYKIPSTSSPLIDLTLIKNINTENNEMFKVSDEKPKEVMDDSIKTTDNINVTSHILKLDNNSFRPNINNITNDICLEGISNISISDKTNKNYENSLIENRKRSYSNRDVDYEKSEIENVFEVVSMKEEQVEESLNNEVLEFLTRWEGQFIDKKLVQVKCTNSKWTFSALDDIILLTVTYLPILKDHNFLKVDDISFTTKSVIQHEIIKFGTNWILSKYNPKVYKQICFSSRDIELLLKSLLEDVKFISKVMNNMFYVSDLYCVTFKDNIAQFCLHSMKCLSMTRIQISLSNIHKLSVKDITVDCLFGFFNENLLNEILNNLSKDYNILESLIVQLKNKIYKKPTG